MTVHLKLPSGEFHVVEFLMQLICQILHRFDVFVNLLFPASVDIGVAIWMRYSSTDGVQVAYSAHIAGLLAGIGLSHHHLE